ncbi:cupin-like domain-containing protein [Sphingomicrobium nitratireducens]|uniref:cupin-like domain-containing protein n=1 Tax=Sphingomicrobium nitratireducens TaxID=2964666 RepID=UPI00223ED02C|nr:cupin-like domain-containing protein [Sphingomicrobium nitratireducens]
MPGSANQPPFDDLPPLDEVAAGERPLDEIVAGETPLVIRGLFDEWPLVAAGRASSEAARTFVLDHARGDRPFVLTSGAPRPRGRIFYDDAMHVDAETERLPLSDAIARMRDHEGDDTPPLLYLTSTDIDGFFEGLAETLPSGLGERHQMLRSIWIGLRSEVPAHNDVPRNLAGVAVGRRRFTLFPPEAMTHLYPGPIDNSPAGRPVSMVDFTAIDSDRFPEADKALAQGRTALLEPGDAIYIPSLWWHQVEALDPFNVLVNFWWRDVPLSWGDPQDALYHAIWTIRSLPEEQRKRWRDQFDHYVFGDPGRAAGHLPDEARGILGPMDTNLGQRLRTYLIRVLNR